MINLFTIQWDIRSGDHGWYSFVVDEGQSPWLYFAVNNRNHTLTQTSSYCVYDTKKLPLDILVESHTV